MFHGIKATTCDTGWIVLSYFWSLLKQASFLGSCASSENWLRLELNYHKSVKRIVDFLSSSSDNFVWTLKQNSLASTNICIIVKTVHKEKSDLKVLNIIRYTGFPRYSRGLRSQDIPRITKPRITRDHFAGIFQCFLWQFSLKSANNQGKSHG